MLTFIKLSKAQLSKIFHSGGLHGACNNTAYDTKKYCCAL